jgi:hypothetical protein
MATAYRITVDSFLRAESPRIESQEGISHPPRRTDSPIRDSACFCDCSISLSGIRDKSARLESVWEDGRHDPIELFRSSDDYRRPKKQAILIHSELDADMGSTRQMP